MATLDIKADEFDGIVEGNDIVIIDFWAEWCGPCKSFAPTYEATSEKEEYKDIVFGKVDTAAEQALAGAFQIRSIPTLMIFREQVGLFRQPGVLNEEQLDDLIKQIRALDMDEVRKDIAEQAAEAEADQAN